MSAHTTSFVDCDGDVCKANPRQRSIYSRVYGADVATAEHEARQLGWLVEVLPEIRHLCPLDRPDAKCGVAPVPASEHLGPWERVEPWMDVSRCVACGYESSK